MPLKWNIFEKFKSKMGKKNFSGLYFVRFLDGIHTRKYPEGTRNWNRNWHQNTGTGSEPAFLGPEPDRNRQFGTRYKPNCEDHDNLGNGNQGPSVERNIMIHDDDNIIKR